MALGVSHCSTQFNKRCTHSQSGDGSGGLAPVQHQIPPGECADSLDGPGGYPAAQVTLTGVGLYKVSLFPWTVGQPQVPARDAEPVADALEDIEASGLPLTRLVFIDTARAQASCAGQAAEGTATAAHQADHSLQVVPAAGLDHPLLTQQGCGHPLGIPARLAHLRDPCLTTQLRLVTPIVLSVSLTDSHDHGTVLIWESQAGAGRRPFQRALSCQ